MNIASKAVLLGFFILFVLLIWATAYCAQPNFSFVMETDGRSGSLIVCDTGNGACHVTIQNIIIFDKETGRSAISEFEGDGIVKNGLIEVTSSNNRNCRLTIRLSNKTANVKLSENFSSCEFGFNGSVDGDYIFSPDNGTKETSSGQEKQELPKNTKAAKLDIKSMTTGDKQNNGEIPDKPILGIQVSDYQSQEVKNSALKVVDVMPNTPSALAGFKVDDVITKTTNKTRNISSTNKNMDEIKNLVNNTRPGDLLEFDVVRKNETTQETVEAHLNLSAGQKTGMRIEDVHFRTPPIKGAIITHILPNSPAETAGLQRDDVILKVINKTRPQEFRISNTSEFDKFINDINFDDLIEIDVARKDNHMHLIKEIHPTVLIFSMARYPNPTTGDYFKTIYANYQAVSGRFVYEKQYDEIFKKDDYYVVGLKTKNCTIEFDTHAKKRASFYKETDKMYGSNDYLWVDYREVIGEDEAEILLLLSGVSNQGLDPCIWANAGAKMVFENLTEDYSKKISEKVKYVLATKRKQRDDQIANGQKEQAIRESQKTPRQKALEQCYSDCFGMAVNYAHGKAKKFVDRDRIIRATESSCKHECDLRLKY